MVSVCTTIYQQKDSLEVFVRSLFGNATGKFELIIVDDENSCKDKLKELNKEFNFKVINRTRRNKYNFAKQLIKFYRANGIFDELILEEMDDNLLKYRVGEIDLWLPTAHNFNLAVKQAIGDLLVFLPADYLIFFDVNKLEEGHFDWLDITSLEPYPDLTIPKKCKSFTDKILAKAIDTVSLIPAQHGARVVSKDKYKEIGGFDERWFIRALAEDRFNQQSDMTRLSETILHKTSPYVGALRSTVGRSFKYLSPRYSEEATIHNYFKERILEWLN